LKATRILLLIVLCSSLLSGCAQLVPVLVPLAQSQMQPSAFNVPTDDARTNAETDGEVDRCAPEDFECTAEQFERDLAREGVIIRITHLCEIGLNHDSCIGTFPYYGAIDFMGQQVEATAIHEGDGEFAVTLFREDNTNDVIFSATGIYTSEIVTFATTGIVSMTVQSTGPWEVDFKRSQ
jgi:hypothetical protein